MKSAILATILLAAAAPVANGSGSADPIEGVWLVKVTLTNCATGEALPFPGAKFDAMAMFAEGGTFHDTNMNPSLVRSSAFGTWQHVRDRVYRFAFRLFNLDSTGTLPTGSTIVRHRVTLSPDGKRYWSQGTAEFYDVSGIRMLPDGCSKSKATRFK